ncbi:hypothetical protein M5E87_23070 [Flavonifractor plautii]|nr:hypothetical protein M5E87_23070 [Flavonifractor plautii]
MHAVDGIAEESGGARRPSGSPAKRLTVRRGAALLLVLALAAGAALGGKALFFSGEEQTPLTEQTTYGSLSTTLSGTGTTMLRADSVTYTTASEAEITGVYVSGLRHGGGGRSALHPGRFRAGRPD